MSLKEQRAMVQSTTAQGSTAGPALLASQAPTALKAYPLLNEQEAEVLGFLAERPLHTIVMTGLILDNGLESPFNRGQFYGCRNAEGELEGVALIGHGMFVETRTEGALKAFAELAQTNSQAHFIMGEHERIERFWSYYANAGQAARVFCRELLFEQRWPVAAHEPVPQLRRATQEDLMRVMPVHAALAYEESGVNPLDVDPQGFRLRCARRIGLGRVWVWVDQRGQLIFKADVIAETPEVVYLEGVWIDWQERGKGYGRRCMSQLGRTLLAQTKALTLVVNEQHRGSQAFFQKAGYRLRSYYDTIFLQPGEKPVG
ncbi:MAG TPA: GNAT family N-acetyltransferase [Pyrinomonadaceae bacterium]